MITDTFLVFALVTGGRFLVEFLLSNRPDDVRQVAALLTQTEHQGWHFIALRYRLGLLNCIYVVFVTTNAVVGARVGGALTSPLASKRADDPWRNPAFYPNRALLAGYLGVDLESDALLAKDRANFRIAKASITGVTWIRRSKWGMGNVPYSGRIVVSRADERPIELVLLGTQDGAGLVERLRRELTPSQSGGIYR